MTVCALDRMVQCLYLMAPTEEAIMVKLLACTACGTHTGAVACVGFTRCWTPKVPWLPFMEAAKVADGVCIWTTVGIGKLALSSLANQTFDALSRNCARHHRAPRA